MDNPTPSAAGPLTRAELARLIDHTQVRANASLVEMEQLCDEAREHGFAAVSVNPVWTSYCARRLKDSPVHVNAMVGFPLGANTSRVKVEEAREAIRNGADELDMVINIGALKSGYTDFVESEVAAVVRAVGAVHVKVILETSYLTTEEKVAVCELSVRAGAAFVKTATGFGRTGATVEDVQLMRRVVGNALGVKAAGGIRTYSQVVAMLQAGASRIGTSAGVRILADVVQSAPLA